jgi:hypothetical protein
MFLEGQMVAYQLEHVLEQLALQVVLVEQLAYQLEHVLEQVALQVVLVEHVLELHLHLCLAARKL